MQQISRELQRPSAVVGSLHHSGALVRGCAHCGTRAADRLQQDLAGDWDAPTRWQKPGQFVTRHRCRRTDRRSARHRRPLRAFYNVCRHHAAKVVTEPCGIASILHCPYHGWNYGLDGSLKGMPEFDGVKNFERKR